MAACLFPLPVNKTAASLTATRPKWPGQKSGSGLGGREGGKKRLWTCVGRVDRPFVFIGCEVAAEFRIEEQHVLLSKIHTLTRLHTDTRICSQCDGRMTSAAVAAGQSALWTFKLVYNLLQIWLQFVNNGDVGVDVYIGNRRGGSVKLCEGDFEQKILTIT